MKEAKCVNEKQVFHYRLSKRYVILSIGSGKKLTAPLFAEKNRNKVFCYFRRTDQRHTRNSYRCWPW